MAQIFTMKLKGNKVKISFVDFRKAVALIVFALAELQPKYPPNAILQFLFYIFCTVQILEKKLFRRLPNGFSYVCVCVFLVNVF